MELTVKEIKQTTVDSDDPKPDAFVTTLEDADGNIVVNARETEDCTFKTGDTWELKKTASQTTLSNGASS